MAILATPMLAQSTCGTAVSSGSHFQKGSVTGTIDSTGDVTIKATEAGLGYGDVCWTVTADVSATYFCRTKSGNIPDASNKHTVNEAVSAGGTFPTKNGKVTASLTLDAPAAPVSEPPTCGNGQTLDLQNITYSNVTLTDTTNNVTGLSGGTFSLTLFPAPK